jgi:hypothetical protein
MRHPARRTRLANEALSPTVSHLRLLTINWKAFFEQTSRGIDSRTDSVKSMPAWISIPATTTAALSKSWRQSNLSSCCTAVIEFAVLNKAQPNSKIHVEYYLVDAAAQRSRKG